MNVVYVLAFLAGAALLMYGVHVAHPTPEGLAASLADGCCCARHRHA